MFRDYTADFVTSVRLLGSDESRVEVLIEAQMLGHILREM